MKRTADDLHGHRVCRFDTQISTRAITFGDYYSYKTGLNVEFEFDESVAERCDRESDSGQGACTRELIAHSFFHFKRTAVRLPLLFPFTLPGSPGRLGSV